MHWLQARVRCCFHTSSFFSNETIIPSFLLLFDIAATAISLLQIFFIVVTVIAIIMCFFVLWLSFTANIREVTKQESKMYYKKSWFIYPNFAVYVYLYVSVCLTCRPECLGVWRFARTRSNVGRSNQLFDRTLFFFFIL